MPLEDRARRLATGPNFCALTTLFSDGSPQTNVTVGGQAARDHIDACSRRYTGRDYDADRITTERVILEIAPTRVNVRGL